VSTEMWLKNLCPSMEVMVVEKWILLGSGPALGIGRFARCPFAFSPISPLQNPHGPIASSSPLFFDAGETADLIISPVALSFDAGETAASGSLRLNPNPRVGECCLPSSLRCRSVRYSTLFGAPIPSKIRLHSDATITTPRAASPAVVEDDSSSETDAIPTPKVIIDQDSDPKSTIVEITFGDRLGTLLDTMKALKNLGLNVVKANVCLDSSGKHNKFAITSASSIC
ncbi:ACT domain-containing protein DS12, chloroplastic-like, partial [Curcuma longa]|uniref:ACT domain-containing protein DS12, chloroplastic-like n=1 Tax=Curcuma longa TaxID=136217 RepID=UPI003D9E1725